MSEVDRLIVEAVRNMGGQATIIAIYREIAPRIGTDGYPQVHNRIKQAAQRGHIVPAAASGVYRLTA